MGIGSSSGKDSKLDNCSVVGGSDLGFEELVSRYGREVYSLCLNLTQSPAESEQVVQEVFSHAFNEISVGASRVSCITQSIYRLAIEHVGEREKVKHPELGRIQPEAGSYQSINRDDDQMLAMVRAAVVKLPYEYRVVYILREMLAKSVADTAELLEISELEVRAFLHRARLIVCRDVQKQRQTKHSKAEAELCPEPNLSRGLLN
jgi:RNA polymerase sigma factor (sigma-70 family)